MTEKNGGRCVEGRRGMGKADAVHGLAGAIAVEGLRGMQYVKPEMFSICSQQARDLQRKSACQTFLCASIYSDSSHCRD